jgi:hypothetical protein
MKICDGEDRSIRESREDNVRLNSKNPVLSLLFSFCWEFQKEVKPELETSSLAARIGRLLAGVEAQNIHMKLYRMNIHHDRAKLPFSQ